MNLFTRINKLNFSQENIASLSHSVRDLKDILAKVGTGLGQQELTNVLAAAMKKDAKLFKKYVLNDALFGGAGALWELHCGDDQLQSEFRNKFNNFCEDLINIGLTNSRITKAMS